MEGIGGAQPLYAHFLRLVHIMWPLALIDTHCVAAAPQDTCQGFSTPLAQTHTYFELKSKE